MTHDVNAGLINLIDSNNNTDVLLVDEVDDLAGLRHDTIVRRNNKDDDVCHPSAACAHCRKGRVSRSVQECDGTCFTIAGYGNREGTDMLRDTARLTLRNRCRAQRVE